MLEKIKGYLNPNNLQIYKINNNNKLVNFLG